MMTLESLLDLFVRNNSTRLYIKELAENDNSKNQVYLGPDFQAINILPNKGIDADPGKQGLIKAKLDFFWIGAEGKISKAPHAKLILYPQYPEVRFSGFLLGCSDPPSALMQPRSGSTLIPKRVLLLAVTATGQIFGYVDTVRAGIGKAVLGQIKDLPRIGVFVDGTILLPTIQEDARTVLLQRLREINSKGWIDAERLNAQGQVVPCLGTNCGGCTLECELDIRPNSLSEPDFMGWEVKQHGVSSFGSLKQKLEKEGGSPITLMTPEPTGGFYKSAGVFDFVRRYGYPDVSGKPDRMNFGGTYFYERTVSRTGLKLTLSGFDIERGKMVDNGELKLVDDRGTCAASWKFTDLLAHWTRKHALAVYVPSIHRKIPNQYSFGNIVRLAEGTDFLKFLNALATGLVYYDPGIKAENVSTSAKIKRRSQFRIKSGNISALYVHTKIQELLGD